MVKYAVDNAHREFFSRYRWIEFEELLSPSALAEINDAIDQVLAHRLIVPLGQIGRQDAQSSYSAGRDLWRDHKRIKQLVLQKPFAEIMAELVEERPLRIAFDQVVDVTPPPPKRQPMTLSLEAMTPFRGLVGGLILCLKPAVGFRSAFFPTKAGNGICVLPTAELALGDLLSSVPQRYLIIGYGKAVTLFVHRPNDAYSSTLRSMGYNYGDRLVDRLHPVVIR